ncbi:MAG: hypothetical protein H7281_07050 [Bacteriovorax sp.]|nr:hypothetical protein [Bacteriovorax sp.]
MKKLLNPFEKFESLKKISITDENQLKKIYEDLLLMDMSTAELVLQFQRQRDIIEKYTVNEMAESYFLMTTDVANEEKKKRKEHFEQVISPINREYDEKLNKKFLESVVAQKLSAPYNILRRNQKNEMDIFCTENIEIHKEIDKISMEITEIQGKLVVNWKGEEIPLPAIYPFLKSPDRQIRKESYECLKIAELAVADIIDEKFDQLLSLRQQLAKNAGFNTYTDYRFKELRRFDWGPSHCFDFHNAVKKHILPLRKKLLEQRKKSLNLDSVKPYDLGVDVEGREPLKIYEKGDSDSLIEGTSKIIKAIDGELYTYFCKIRENNLLDLDSRENKAPGGYMVMYPIFEQASVFYNGVGLSSDLMVLLHELGHCFHYFLGKDVEPYALQNCTSEVAEAGSMSMEYIGLEKMSEYLGIDQCKRIKEDKLKNIIGLFSSCARGDEFQHWLYANPGHSSQMRREKWIELNRIYNEGLDFDGYEDRLAKIEWQFLHILQMPFYLIDYSISELLALTIWDRYKANPSDGIDSYKKGCSAAASKTVPEIYELFGTTLSFGEEVIAPLATRLENELGL